MVATLRNYLEYGRVQSGEAINSARADYQNISRRKNAASHISKAWAELVSEPDTLLIDLIAEKAEALCGYRPASEDVEAFLVADTRLNLAQEIPARPLSREPNLKPVTSPVSERSVKYSLLGQAKSAPNATEALIDILRTLDARIPNFLATLAPLVRGTSRNHIATSRTEVYPQKPELLEYTTELRPGWWLGTNIANREKMRIIAKACEVANLTLGRDVVISLVNAS